VVWRRLAQDYPARRANIGHGQPTASDKSGVAGASGASAVPPHQRVKRLLIVVNNPLFFLSHRLQLALDAKQAGYDVHIATMDGSAVAEVVSHGLIHHVIPMSRSGKNPLEEAHTLYALWGLFRRL